MLTSTCTCVSNFNQKCQTKLLSELHKSYDQHNITSAPHTHSYGLDQNTPFFNRDTRSARFCGFRASKCITLSLRLWEGRGEPVPPPEDGLFVECFKEALGGGGRGWTGRFGLRTAGEILLSAGCVRIFFDFDRSGEMKMVIQTHNTN